jgi:hypothetical protein
MISAGSGPLGSPPPGAIAALLVQERELIQKSLMTAYARNFISNAVANQMNSPKIQHMLQRAMAVSEADAVRLADYIRKEAIASSEASFRQNVALTLYWDRRRKAEAAAKSAVDQQECTPFLPHQQPMQGTQRDAPQVFAQPPAPLPALAPAARSHEGFQRTTSAAALPSATPCKYAAKEPERTDDALAVPSISRTNLASFAASPKDTPSARENVMKSEGPHILSGQPFKSEHVSLSQVRTETGTAATEAKSKHISDANSMMAKAPISSTACKGRFAPVTSSAGQVTLLDPAAAMDLLLVSLADSNTWRSGQAVARPLPSVGRLDAPAPVQSGEHKTMGYRSQNKNLLMFWNIGNMHWNLIRVKLGLRKEIEVYEPMGRAGGRAGTSYRSEGLSLRSVPKALIQWLDTVCPLATAGGWRARTVSAIQSAHQGNGFDCGVACLLYAEKCGQGQEKEDIGNFTDQNDFTRYRKTLQDYFASFM